LERKIPRRIEELHPRAHVLTSSRARGFSSAQVPPPSNNGQSPGGGGPTCGHGIGASPARGVERRQCLSAIPEDLIPIATCLNSNAFCGRWAVLRAVDSQECPTQPILPHSSGIAPRIRYCPTHPILPHAADVLHTPSAPPCSDNELVPPGAPKPARQTRPLVPPPQSSTHHTARRKHRAPQSSPPPAAPPPPSRAARRNPPAATQQLKHPPREKRWKGCQILHVIEAGDIAQKWRTGHDAIPHPGYWGAAPVALQARSASWPRPGVRAGLPVCLDLDR
jgi:hypothetical protein